MILAEKAKKLLAKDSYIKATEKSEYNIAGKKAAEDLQIVALSCLDDNLAESKTFQTQMLLPSGEYTAIRLYAYTNKGVYVYTIDDECEALPDDKKTTLNKNSLTLKRERVALHNIIAYNATDNPNADYTALGNEGTYINMTETLSNAELSADEETEGTVVISQADLIAVINGIAQVGNVEIRVLGDRVKITKEVADAIVAKEKALAGDIQLVFNDKVEIVGETTAYDLEDVTFEGGAELISGKVNISDDVHIVSETGNHLTIAAGAELSVNEVANSAKTYTYYKLINNGSLTINAEDVSIRNLNNYGSLTFAKDAAIKYCNNYAGSATIINENVELTAQLTSNNSSDGLTGAALTNNGIINLSEASVNSSKSTITNNGSLNTKSFEFINNGTIENEKKGKIVSGISGKDGGVVKNAVGATINNKGSMLCLNGENRINNLGTINAKTGSTTYITTNSDKNEFGNGTAECTMGVINLDNRNEDVAVTTPEQKGYIVFTTDLTKIEKEFGDKFNKVVLSQNAKVEDDNVKYITTSAETVNIGRSSIQEMTFNSDCTLYSENATVASITIATDKLVKLPTDNLLSVQTVMTSGSKTVGHIDNNGTFLVGGNLYSDAAAGGLASCPDKGIFASGDGSSTAFHWGSAKP